MEREIKTGDLYLANNGEYEGYLVINPDPIGSRNVLVVPFNRSRGLIFEERKFITIDRLNSRFYFCPDPIPDWIPLDVVADYHSLKSFELKRRSDV